MIFKRYISTSDTTELTQCLAYINEHFDPQDLRLIRLILKASELSESRSHAGITFGMYSILKKFYDCTGNTSKSFEYALKIYKSLNQTPHSDGLMWILIDIGNVFYNQKDYEQAMLFYRRAEKIAHKGKDRYPLSVIYMNYGLAEANQGHYREALEHYKISSRYRRESENIKYISSTYIRIANAYLQLGLQDSTMHYIRLAEDYYYHKGEPTHTLRDMPDYIYSAYAAFYASRQDYRKAFRYLSKAKAYSLAQHLTEAYITDVKTEAGYYAAQGKYAEAIRCITGLLPMLRDDELKEQQKDAYRLLGGFYSLTGNYRESDLAMQRFIELDDSLDANFLSAQLDIIRSFSSMYENEAKVRQTRKNLHLAQLQNRINVRERNASIIVTSISVLIILVLLTLFMNIRMNRRKLRKLHGKLVIRHRVLSENSTELEATSQLKEKLFSIIAHDLRNPLNRMLVELAIVKKSIGEQHLTATMERTLKETIGLFEGLLQWSKLDNKQHVYTPARVNFNDLVRKALLEYAPEINARGIRVTTRTEPLLVFADQHILQTFMRNLISNGIIFATMNEQLRTLEIDLAAEGDRAILQVSNSGPRFTEEMIADFYSDDHSLSARSGLAISICKLLAGMCGWETDISNHPDKEGVCVTIRIPLFISSKPDARQVMDTTFVLPEAFLPRLEGLKQLRFYQTSQIRAYLRTLSDISDETVKLWLQSMENAVHEGDERGYAALIDILDVKAAVSADY